jgi:hypothetical protein
VTHLGFVGLACLLAGATQTESCCIFTGVEGTVTDVAGSAIEGVQVTSGASIALTAGDGSYRMEMGPGEDQIVVFSRQGYVTSSWRVSVYDQQTTNLPVTMMAQAAAKTMNATTGATVTGARNASMTAPAGAFVDAAGNAVTGNVEVCLTPYDPSVSGELAAYPGELRGLTLTGETVPMVTYGVLDVTVRQNGEELQIASGQTITVQVPAPASGEKPDTAEVWIFDEETSLWVQSDQGDATYDAASNTYIATTSTGRSCRLVFGAW